MTSHEPPFGRWERTIFDQSRGRVTCHITALSSPRRPAMASSLGGQCPSCHKRFTCESSVLRHMNNPRTSCMNWFSFVESTVRPDVQISPAYQQNQSEAYHDDRPTHDNEAAGNLSPEYYEELHPNVPFVFGSGPGFVDVFNTDRHAEKRKDNLYYPFSSKAEWGLASWLLCSGLSMRAIDGFLALPIVSPKTYANRFILTIK